MHFISLIRASLVVIVVASIVCNSDAVIPYVNGANIPSVNGANNQYVNSATFFGRCFNFAIQAGTAVAFNGAQTNVTNGNIGVAPGNSITGTPNQSAGYTQEKNSDSAKNCAADEKIAYDQLKALNCTTQNTLPSSDLAGLTLSPGVYCSASGTFIISATTLTLNGNGDFNSQFIFQTATTITTATATSFILTNGAQAKNVFWQVGSSATLGYSSAFTGHILAGVTINVGHTTTVVGKLLGQAAVNFEGGDQTTSPS